MRDHECDRSDLERRSFATQFAFAEVQYPFAAQIGVKLPGSPKHFHDFGPLTAGRYGKGLPIGREISLDCSAGSFNV